MSLRVWLPLNGDLHNQGLSNVNLTNTVTFATSGKIGASCLNSQLGWFAVPEMAGKKQMSFAYWVKLNTGTTTNWLDSFSWYSTNGTSDHRSRQEFYYYNNGGNTEAMTTGVWYYTSSNSGLTQRKIGQWYHYAFTIDYATGITQFFVDGVLWKTTTDADTSYYVKGNNFLLRESSLDCSINDFRLYDHILSELEVKEIAHAKILHYPLCDKNVEMTTNLCNGLKSGGRTTLSSNPIKITTTGENADTYWYIKTSTALVSGTVYTISLNCTGLSNGEYWKFGVGAQSGNNNCGYFSIYQGYNTFTFTLPSGLNGATQLILDDIGGSSGIRNKITNFFNVQLEAKDHATAFVNYGTSRTSALVYDISGYCNNGIIIGDLEVSTPSPRYSCATKFDGSSAIKVNDNNWMAQGASDLTVNIWAYMDNWSNWNGHRLYSCTEGGGFNIENTIANSLTFPVCVYTNTAHSATGYIPTESRVAILKTDLTSGWHMLTYIYTETECQCYLDGVLYQTKPYTSYGVYFNINGSRLFLGCEANGVNAYSPYFIGQESDFRIYYTALNAQDILSLYHNSALIDEQGIIHGAIH